MATSLMAVSSSPVESERPELQPVTREPGFPDWTWMAGRYSQLTGRSVANLCWYRVLAIWKAAIFLEQSYKRFLLGNEHDAWFAEMGEGVPELADQAWQTALKG